jgi:hypothetical protein
MRTLDVITPDFLHYLQVILSLGLKPDSFNAETALARSLPAAERKGGNTTLVDVLTTFSGIRLGLDVKGTNTIKVLKRAPKDPCIEYGGNWVRIPKDAMVITRRPDVDCFSGISAEEGIANSVNRLWEFYKKSKEKEKCQEVYSLLIQHSWHKERQFTVFNFSLSKFEIPVATSYRRDGNALKGFDENGDLCLLHDAFTRGSQNFSKRYHVYDDAITAIIDHNTLSTNKKEWADLDGITICS